MPIRPSRPSPFDCAQGRFYDAAGRRVRATVAGVTTDYPFDHYEVAGTTIRKYYALGGQRVAMRTNGVLSYLLTDHLGSTAVTTDAAGAKTGELRYLPFGATRTTWGVIPTDRRFTGQSRYATLELDYFGARWYDPALGRFAQADTIVPEPGNPQALNRYSYALNNALRYTDPTGHSPIDWARRTISNAYKVFRWINENVELRPFPKEQVLLPADQKVIVDTLAATAITADTVALSLSSAGLSAELALMLVDGPAPFGDVGALGIYYGIINPAENAATTISFASTLASDAIKGNTYVRLHPASAAIGQDTLVSAISAALGNLLPLEGGLDTLINIPTLTPLKKGRG